MTIRQLARDLGLSKSAVAYALKGSPQVSPETRERVQKRARELGYDPNPIASAFLQQVRSQGSQAYRANLAFLFRRQKRAERSALDPMTSGPFVKFLVEGARERAAELGYGLEDIHTGGNQAGKLTRLLLARGVVGVVIAPLYHAVGHMSLDWGRFAVVAFGNSMVRPSVHRLTHHHMHGMQTVLRVCRKKGFRRIGLALSLDSDARSDRAWSSGYLGTQVTWAPSEQVAPLLVPLSEFTSKRIDEWIKKERPDVVVIHATGCISAECLAKQSVPFVVLDREPYDILAGMNQQFRLAGRLIIDALSAQIVHNQRGLPATPIVSMIEGLWEDHPSFSKA